MNFAEEMACYLWQLNPDSSVELSDQSVDAALWFKFFQFCLKTSNTQQRAADLSRDNEQSYSRVLTLVQIA